MFGELSKLFDRDFAIAYVLPAIAFVAANTGLRHDYGLLPKWLTLTSESLLGDSALLGLLALIIAMFLSALNREIIRLMEGYGTLNAFRLIAGLELQRFKRLRKKARSVNERYSKSYYADESEKKEFQRLQKQRPKLIRLCRYYAVHYVTRKGLVDPVCKTPLLNRLISKHHFSEPKKTERFRNKFCSKQKKLNRHRSLVESRSLTSRLGKQREQITKTLTLRFPDSEHLVLPTAFGNTLRAFEVYPRIMYGFEGVEGWPRLVTVIPDSYRKLINSAKAQTDFWVNIWLLAVIFSGEFTAFSIIVARRQHDLSIFRAFLNVLHTHPTAALLGGSALVLLFIASFLARTSAEQWGLWVKSAFDTYLPNLVKKLALPPPANIDEERELWTTFSQAIRYGLPKNIVSHQYSVSSNEEKLADSSKEQED